MTATNLTPMSPTTQSPTCAEFLAALLNENGYPGTQAVPKEDRIAVPITRPDGVASIEITLWQPGEWFLTCSEPSLWRAARDLGADRFNLIAEGFGLDDDRENEAITSLGRKHFNHQMLEWADNYLQGLQAIIWCAWVFGRSRTDYDSAIQCAAEGLYEAECAYTGSLKVGPYDALSAEQQQGYTDGIKAALCGRIGHLNDSANRRTLAMARLEHLRGLDPFAADTALKVGRSAVEQLDDERVIVLDEHRAESLITNSPSNRLSLNRS